MLSVSLGEDSLFSAQAEIIPGIPLPQIEEESLLRSGGDNSYDRGNAVLINVSSPLRRR